MLGYCLSSIVSLGMQEPWRGESVATSSTELLLIVRLPARYGGGDYSR